MAPVASCRGASRAWRWCGSAAWSSPYGSADSLEALRPEYSRVELSRIRRFDVPVIFMLGRHDWRVPAVLAAEWFGTIEAPHKRLVWFERSAHDPPFEQPAAFVTAMREHVLPLARAPRPATSPAAPTGLVGDRRDSRVDHCPTAHDGARSRLR